MERDFFEIDAALLRENASQALQQALSAHRAVAVPRLDFPMELDRPIVLDSGSALRVHPETIVRMKAGCGGCMARNRHVYDERGGVGENIACDLDILLEGGIWEESERAPSVNDPDETMRDLSHIISGTVFFNRAERVVIRHMTLRRGNQYGVLLAACRDFVVDDLFFDDYYKDGVHVNGPSENGVIEHMRGHCGDDFVALNAWDWDSSSVSFGGIRNIVVRHIACEGDEMRLIPGRKTYKSGRKTLCPVENCVFEDISGVYNFKMYQQPNCHNGERPAAERDYSDIPGLMKNIVFRRVHIAARAGGLAEVSLDGVFEIGADCCNAAFEDVELDVTAAALKDAGMALVSVGPKSSTWTRGYSDPAKWCELFEPDLICTAENLAFARVRMGGAPCADKDALVQARHLTVNPDYPRTTPRGGTGYGVIKGVDIQR